MAGSPRRPRIRSRNGPALQRAVEQLTFQSQLLEALAQPVVATDLSGIITFWNGPAEDLYGWSEEEALGLPILELLSLDAVDTNGMLSMAEAALGSPHGGRRLLRHRDGTLLLIDTLLTPMLDADGRVIGLVGVSSEVTDQVAGEPGGGQPLRDLALAEERLRAVRDSNLMAETMCDLEGRLVMANQAFADLLGYDPAELVGRHMADLAGPEDRNEVIANLGRAAAGEELERSGRRHWLRKDGRTVTTASWPAVIRDGDRPVYVVGIHKDISELIEAQERAETTERRLEALVRYSYDTVYLVDREGRITYASPGVRDLLGYEPDEVVGVPALELAHPQDRASVRARVAAIDGRMTFEVRVRHAAGHWVWLEESILDMNDDPALRGYVVNVRDVTDRRAAEDRLRLLAAVVDNSDLAVVSLDVEGRVTSWNPRAEALFEWTEAEILGRSFFLLIAEEDRRTAASALASLIRGGQIERSPIRPVTRSGRSFHAVVSAHPIRDASGRVVGAATLVRDMDVQVQTDRALAQMSLRDRLTGLPERALLLDHLGEAVNRTGTPLAALLIDLDRISVVNDSLGQDCGDRLLQIVAGRLKRAVGPRDMVARFGGDEFAVLCEGRDEMAVTALAEAIRASIARPVTLDGHELVQTASIGIAFSGAGARAALTGDLLREADCAMHRAKELGGDRAELFDENIPREASARLQLSAELRHAIEAGELKLHYQPIVRMADLSTVGYEALVRWQHPEQGLITPDRFIPIAEETGLIVELGRWTLEEACREAARWASACPGAPGVSVNLSARQLSRPELADVVAGALEASGLAPGALTLEVTETALMEHPDRAQETLCRLRDLGVRLAIDDFGTGYSSLLYLRRLPVDVLKIDRTFVGGLTTDEDDAAIVRAVIGLAHSVGVTVVAEGVETEEQSSTLRDLRCDFAQGYLWGRPAPDPLPFVR